MSDKYAARCVLAFSKEKVQSVPYLIPAELFQLLEGEERRGRRRRETEPERE